MKKKEEMNKVKSMNKEGEDELCFKRFKYLSSVVSDKLKHQQTPTSKHMVTETFPFKEQVEKDFAETPSISEDADVFEFWTKHESLYPDVADIAFDLLTIPASSAPVERLFSTAGSVSAGKRNRISGDKLEREVFIKKNKHFLQL